MGASIRQRLSFFAKAATLLGLLYAFGVFGPSMHPATIALVWASLSTFSAVGLAYQLVVRKTHRQVMFNENGVHSRINRGRILGLTVSFVTSAAFTIGLLLEAPKWERPEWLLLACAIPLFCIVAMIANRVLSREFKSEYRTSRTVLYSSAITAVLLCAAYAAMIWLSPVATFADAARAFESVPKPFDASPSALMAEVGKITALADGFAAFGMSKAAEVSPAGYVAWKMVLYASVAFGFANLLGACSLGLAELRRVFEPLPENGSLGHDPAIVWRYVATVALLPILLIASFLAADSSAATVAASNEYTAAEKFVGEKVGLAVYVLDGKYYEQEAAQRAVEEARAQWAAVASEAEETLLPLVNESYDARIANVDAFLDWYYSLPADYERLANMITGNVDSFVEDQFVSQIEAGIDDTRIAEELDAFTGQRAAIEAELMETLAQYEITDLPDWMLTTRQALDISFLTEMPQATQELVGEGGRFGISAAAGVGSGVIAKRIIKKAAGKEFFKVIVARISSALASRGIGAAAGGAVGTALGPVGTVVGIALGTAVGVGVDYGMLKLDEAQNREQYRQEIVQSIEESRAETIDLVQSSFGTGE